MTDKENFENFPVKQRQKRKKGRPNVEKRGGAREIVKNLQWLSFPLIYWSGTGTKIPFRGDYLYRPVQFLIGEKLKGLPTGIYAVQLTFEGKKSESENSEEKQEYLINPLVDCIRVTENLIAKTSRALQAARKYPRALPKIIPDVKKWLEQQAVILNRVGATLKAISKMGNSHPDRLAIEESCLWLGQDKDQPSQRIHPEKILSWVKENDDSESPGKILAAIVLGIEKKKANLPENLKIWNRLGSTLFRWPVDIVAKLKLGKKISSSDFSIFKELNHPHVALALWERVIGGQSIDIDFLKKLSALNRSCFRLESEPHRRGQALLQIMNNTIKDIREKVDEDDFTTGDNAIESENRIQFFADAFIPNYLEFINKQGLLLNNKELSPKKMLDFAYWYCLGGHFPTIFFNNRKWKTIFNELQKDLHYFDVKTGEPEDILPVIPGMAVRMTGQANGEKDLKNLTQWLEVLLIYWFWNEDRNDPGVLAVQILETGWIASRGDPSNLDRFFFLLSERGHDLLGHDLLYLITSISQPDFSLSRELINEWMITMGVVSRYGSLTPEQCGFVIDRNMIYSTRAVMKKGTPDALKDYVQWLEHQDEKWFDLTLHHRLIWARLFRLPNRTLKKWLLFWASETVEKSGLSWVQMSQLLNTILRFCVSESHLEDDPYEPDDYPDEKERQQFIKNHRWIIDVIIDSIKKYIFLNDGSEISGNDRFEEALYRRTPVLDIGYYWESQSYRDEKKMVTRLLNLCQEKEEIHLKENKSIDHADFFSSDSDFQKLMVILSYGEVFRLLDFLVRSARENTNYKKLIQGWEYCRKFPGVSQFLLSRFIKIDYQADVFQVLNLMETVRLLPEQKLLITFLKNWECPQADEKHSFPHRISKEAQVLWQEYIYYKNLNRADRTVSEKIQKIIDLPAILENEHQALVKNKRAGLLDRSAIKRLEKVSATLGDSEAINDLIDQKLSRLLPRQVPLLKMEALEKGIKIVIQKHWKTMVKGKVIEAGDPDWDNALWLYLSTNKNRRILRRLLNQEARQDRKWTIEYPLNQKYLKALKKSGVDTGVWIKGFEKTWNVNGQVWQVYTETNPLKIFHMGNMFNTCLKVGGIHDYSVVANALEMNKRVLYLKNETGKILGRKLLLLREDGTLFGCHSYGSCDSYDFNYGGSPWVKICFDLFCMELARKCKLKFPNREDTVSEDDFKLFSNWYFDGTERFDPWITGRLAPTGKKSKSLLVAMYKDIHQRLMSDRFADEDLFRLFIWLGDDLMPVIDRVLQSPLIKKENLIYISRLTQSQQVKKIIRKNLD